MPSFPKRLTRSALGPKLVDNYPVENPTNELGAGTFNPDFWAVSGMAGIIARASLVASWNGTTFDILHRREAWNPDDDQAHPVLARTSAGVYTYTFPATALDEDGNAVNIILTGARCSSEVAHANGRIRAYAWPNSGSPLVVDIKLEDSAGTARDAKFWLEVL
jgi:hypothetical protein